MPGSQHVVEYDALGAVRHLWTLAGSSTRDQLPGKVEQLHAHGDKDGTQLFETVEAYLDEQGNREGVRRGLGIHRNTLRQRTDRIRRGSNIDLEDRTTRFELQVAVGIVRFRDVQ